MVVFVADVIIIIIANSCYKILSKQAKFQIIPCSLTNASTHLLLFAYKIVAR